MSDVNFVVVMLHASFKCKSVIKATSLSFHGVLVVADVFAVTVPANTSTLGRLFVRVEQWFLPLIIRTVGFYQINDIEFVLYTFARVCYTEVEPLGIRCGLVIVLQDKIISVVSHVNCSP